MAIEKAYWVTNGDDVKVVMPIAKVNEEQRLVSGFASLNNVDQHDEVVTLEASVDAFSRFRGNIREMHQPIAAGRMVQFNQETFYDARTGAAYEGIFVTAYVSRGAQATWEKVLDGTLSGFSIGGFVKNSHTKYIPDLEKSIRFITELDLIELSLVDNPANQYANVLSITKVGDSLVAKGMATEVETQNVFWCPDDQVAKSSADESTSCSACSSPMENIGWIEVTDVAKVTAELKKFVDNWTSKSVITSQQIKEELGKEKVEQNSEFANEDNVGDNKDKAEKSEGGVSMSDVETVEKAAEVDEVVEPVAEEAVEKAADVEESVEEVVAEETVEKSADETVEEVADVPAVDLSALEKSISAIEGTLAETAASVEKSAPVLDAVIKTLESITATVAEVAAKVDDVASHVNALENSTATKKSGDDLDSEPVTKGFSWGGRFASTSSITN
jgi:Caudovirus prohead serine protease